MDTHKMKYLYRAHENYIPGTDILCRDKDSDMTFVEHVNLGTNKTKKSKFISLTKSMGVGISYSLGQGNGKAKERSIIDRVRAPIVLVDESKIGEKIYDLVENKELQQELYAKGNRKAVDYAISSQEVLTEYRIPSTAIKEIPYFFVDIIRAFEIAKYEAHSLENEYLYDIMIEAICDCIMQGKILPESINSIFSEVKLSGIEGKFIRMNYMKDPKPMGEILDNLCSGDITAFNAIRNNIIRKCGESKALEGFIKDMIDEKEKNGEISENYKTNVIKLLDNARKGNGILYNFVDYWDGQPLPRTARPFDHEKAYKTVGEKKNPEKDYYAFGGCHKFKFNKEKTINNDNRIRMPYSIISHEYNESKLKDGVMDCKILYNYRILSREASGYTLHDVLGNKEPACVRIISRNQFKKPDDDGGPGGDLNL